jgi:hypothetical protein
MKFSKYLLIILLQLTLGASISWSITIGGKVYGNSNPLAGVGITIANSASGVEVGSTVTKADGAYEVSVSPGKYNIIVLPPKGYGSSTINNISVETADVLQDILL